MSIRQRLYPNDTHVAGLQMHADHARFLYNLGLEQRSMWARTKHDRGPELSVKPVTAASQQRELTELRKELDWLRDGATSVQQGALRDLDRAFANFFARRGNYPTFKRRDPRHGAFIVRDLRVCRINRRWGAVLVPKVGFVRFRVTRPWTDIEAASSARITRHNGIWHVSFTTPPKPKIMAGTGAIVGIDRGIANTIALSEGHMATIPALTAGEQRRFVALEQRLVRQTRAAKKAKRKLSECRNRDKTISQLAALRARLDNRRTNWVEQQTTQLARYFDATVIEDLQVRNMVRVPKPKPDPDNEGAFLRNGARAKASLNRAIHGCRWSQLATRLEDKTVVVKVPAAYTSQTCRACGHVALENRESQAGFKCVSCGHQGHADTNAARNILAKGEAQALRLLGDAAKPSDGRGSAATSLTTPQQSANPRGKCTIREVAA